MTTFDDKEKAHENKFAHDAELNFKITARRNKLLGLWAAEKLGLAKDKAEGYAKEVVQADFDRPGEDDVTEKLLADFAKAGIAITVKEIKEQIVKLEPVARKEIMSK